MSYINGDQGSNLTSMQVVSLLARFPSFDKLVYGSLKRLNGVEVSVLLRRHPQLASSLPLDTMDKYDWKYLLIKQPELQGLRDTLELGDLSENEKILHDIQKRRAN